MEGTRLGNLPIIGMIQRGKIEITPKGTKRVIELDHFVAKVTDENMICFLKKFNEIYENKSSLDIEIFDENPLTTKYTRYNQSGIVCSCPTTSNKAYQKIKNGWQEIECSGDCIHRQRNEQGKCNCNRIGWFKFFMPKICTDRIWLMKITGQTSINRLQDYFTLQQMQGNSIKGHYKLFLKKEEVSDFTGKTYNHYILDIMKKVDNTFLNNISSTNELDSKSSLEEKQKMDTNIQNVDIPENKNQKEKSKTNITPKTKKQNSKPTTKCEKSTTEKENVVNNKVEEKQQLNQDTTSLDNCYVLTRTYTQNIEQKDGEKKPYLIGEFYDMDDNKFDIAIKPEDAEELLNCEMGTVAKIDLKTIGNMNFALKLEYVQKLAKKIAA